MDLYKDSKTDLLEIIDKWHKSSNISQNDKVVKLLGFAKRWDKPPKDEGNEQMMSLAKSINTTSRLIDQLSLARVDVSDLKTKKETLEKQLSDYEKLNGVVVYKFKKGKNPLFSMKLLYNSIKKTELVKKKIIKDNDTADVSSLDTQIEKDRRKLSELENIHGKFIPPEKKK